MSEFPELENLTPEEALVLWEWPAKRDTWLANNLRRRMPAGFMAAIYFLAEPAMDARDAALAARQTQALASPSNLRRKDTEHLRAFLKSAEGRLPLGMTRVGTLCITEGLSIAKAAEILGISPNTVRRHLALIRERAAPLKGRRGRACESAPGGASGGATRWG
jgi:DNA-directed RNA polymerase specialized sigma24 family protein